MDQLPSELREHFRAVVSALAQWENSASFKVMHADDRRAIRDALCGLSYLMGPVQQVVIERGPYLPAEQQQEGSAGGE